MNAQDVVVGAAVDGQRERVWHATRREGGELVCYLNPDVAEVVFDGARWSVRVSVDQLCPWAEVVT